jgi:Uma2 family endonuclease
VSNIPGLRHCLQVANIRLQFSAYQLAHPTRIHYLGGSFECKLLAPEWESERHPDVAVYLTPPPPEEQPWRNWLPDIVVEVVSSRSEERDYVEKREEYLSLPIKEYWIFDLDPQEMLVLRRWGKRIVERIVRPSEIYKTRMLPGFEFDCAAVFEAAS